jgi:hypothetical protein
VNLFTNFMAMVFYLFTRYCKPNFKAIPDPATGEELTEKDKKFELKKVLELPWVFWCVMLFSLFESSTAVVFQQNATELAEVRFRTDAVTAGWYTSVLQYAGGLSIGLLEAEYVRSLTLKGFFVVPCIGIFIDLYGNRISISKSNVQFQSS